MDTFIETALSWALTAVKAYPPATVYLGIAATVAGLLLLAQPLLRSLVQWTDNNVDDVALKWVLFVADKLTPTKTVRAAKVGTKDDVDKKVVDNLVAKYGGAADVPMFVLETMTKAQKDALADRYVDEATSPDA